jgi:hypothetical protein
LFGPEVHFDVKQLPCPGLLPTHGDCLDRQFKLAKLFGIVEGRKACQRRLDLAKRVFLYLIFADELVTDARADTP